MRFHLPALPGQPTIRDNSHCAYTQKVRRFSEMMTKRGHEVILYGNSINDADCHEFVRCGSGEPLAFDPEVWSDYNLAISKEIKEREEPGDFLLLIAGRCQRALAQYHPDLIAVEFGIGYGGVFAQFKVFESYTWMHSVYAQHYADAHAIDGQFYDTVIPNYFDVDDFPFEEEKEDYVLYVGRMTPRKGVQIAADAAEMADLPLICAGEGNDIPEYAEYIGPVKPEARGDLMKHARCLIAPTLYIEPFGGAAVEAQLCGTPVLTTDWGAYTETVIKGFNGYRCRSIGEFADGMELVKALNPEDIREMAISRFSTDAIAPQYEDYFSRLSDLNNGLDFYSSVSYLTHHSNV